MNKLLEAIQMSAISSSQTLNVHNITYVNAEFSINCLLNSNGSETEYGSWVSTDYMEIPSGKNVVCFWGKGFHSGSSGCGIVFYDSNKSVVGYHLYDGISSFSQTFMKEIPSNATYIRFSKIETIQYEVGNIVIFGEKQDSALDEKINSLSVELSDFINKINIEEKYPYWGVDSDVWQRGKAPNSSGSFQGIAGFLAAQIDVSSYRGKTLSTNYMDGNTGWIRCGFLDEEGNLTVVNFKDNPEYVIPENAKYVNICVNKDNADKNFYAGILTGNEIDISNINSKLDVLSEKVVSIR